MCGISIKKVVTIYSKKVAIITVLSYCGLCEDTYRKDHGHGCVSNKYRTNRVSVFSYDAPILLIKYTRNAKGGSRDEK